MGDRLVDRLLMADAENPASLTHAEFRHAARIAWKVLDGGDLLWASPKTLGRWLGVAPGSAQRIRSVLVDRGFLVPLDDRKGGRSETARFKVVPERLVPMVEPETPSEKVEVSAAETPSEKAGNPLREGRETPSEKEGQGTPKKYSQISTHTREARSSSSSTSTDLPTLWTEAAAIWGEPRTASEKKKRGGDVRELERAGLPPEALRPLVEKAVRRWGGRVRPSLGTIVSNLGDLLDGFDIDAETFRQSSEEEERLARLDRLQALEAEAEAAEAEPSRAAAEGGSA